MVTLVQTSSTGIDTHEANSFKQRGRNTEHKVNKLTQTNGSSQRKRSKDSKYRHVFATHSASRTTCLSHGSEDTPSFVGFKNLMILVLSMHSHTQSISFTNCSSRLQPAVDDSEYSEVRRPYLH